MLFYLVMASLVEAERSANKIRPVHVMDVAQALTNLISMPTLAQTLNLPGPSALTYEYLLT